jgi:hypothetical protein
MNLKAKNIFEQNINNNHTFAHIKIISQTSNYYYYLIIHTKTLLIFKKNCAHLIRKKTHLKKMKKPYLKQCVGYKRTLRSKF